MTNKTKEIEYISVLSIVLIISLLLLAQFGAMYADRKWSRYVKSLESMGVKCEKHRQNTGPPHSRKRYYVCDNGETIMWWKRKWF